MNIKKEITDKIDINNINIDINKYENNTSSIGKKLKRNKIIEDEKMIYIKFEVKSTRDIAEVRICSFSSNVQYIQLVKVDDSYRGKGIGSILFKYIIDDLIPHNENTIYIKPTNKAMKLICRKNNFSESKEIPSWYKL
jgi:GNAT superfamily N-acetyltransferase